jgi:putative methionine-R-sulfoxide reductase with GAF domain
MPNASVLALYTPQQRNARWIGSVTLGMMGLLTLFGLYLVWRSPTWDQFLILGIFVGLGLASLLNVWLNRRGRPDAGMLFYLWVNFMAYPAVALIVSDVGLLLAAVCVVFTSGIASLTVSRANVTRVTIGSLVVGVGVLLLDFYVPMPWRTPVPRPEFMYAFVAVMAVVYFAYMTRQLRTFTLRGKLILAFIGVSLASVGTVAAVSGWLNQQALQAAANNSLQGAASQTATRLDDFFRTNTTGIWADAQSPALAEYLTTLNPTPDLELKVKNTLAAFGQRNMALTSSYAILNVRGLDVQDTYPADLGQAKADRGYFRMVMQTGRPYASAMEISQSTNRPSLFFAAPVHDRAGKIVGVLRVRFDASVLQDMITSAYGLAGRDSFAVLLDENYIRLADGQSPGDIFKAVMPLSAARVAELQAAYRLPARPIEDLATRVPAFERGLALADQQPIFAAPLASLKGAIATGAVHQLTTQPWYVVVFQPQATFLAPAQAQLHLLIILTILIAGLAAGAALIFAQLLTAPISRLASVAARISAGDLNARARVDSADEIGALASNFNSMTSQLHDIIATLERRVAERTKAVETSAEVSRRLSTITNPQQLVLAVVDEIKQAFGYYHAHIYLFDGSRQNLVLAGGTGEAGRTLLSQGHKILKGKGLVGRAAETNAIVLVSDTYSDPGWLPNPLLPETKSEVAVPLAVGHRVLGVLDVQHNLMNGLTPADAQLLEAIGRQVAIALQNARSYTQTQQVARREALVNLIGNKIQSAVTVEEVLQIAASELGTALRASRASVQLGKAALPRPPENSAVRGD